MIALTMLALGVVIAFVSAAAGAALVTTARSDLAEAITRRLRGGDDSLQWIGEAERQIVVAGAVTSLGLILVGAAIPGVVGAALWPVTLLALAITVPAALLGGYLLPRRLTTPRAGRIVGAARPALRALARVLAPILPSHVPDPADDVRAILREGEAKGLGGDRLVMVGGVMSFSERPVRAVMTPRTAMTALAHGMTWPEIMAVFAESGYTRLPVYRENLDEIIGMVHAFDLFKVRPGDPLPLRPVTFAPESRQAGDLLVDMQRDRRHFAVVLDEFGGTAGIVTLEDLLEGLVGEIADEDELPTTVMPEPVSSFEFDGTTPPAEVADRLDIEFPPGEAVSIGGLVAELLGRIPRAGERFRLRGLDIDILQASPTRIDRLLIRPSGAVRIPLDRDPR